MDKIPLKEVHAWEQGFLEFNHTQKKAIWQKITDTRQMDDATMQEVDQAIGEFPKMFAGEKETVRV